MSRTLSPGFTTPGLKRQRTANRVIDSDALPEYNKLDYYSKSGKATEHCSFGVSRRNKGWDYDVIGLTPFVSWRLHEKGRTGMGINRVGLRINFW